MKFEQEHFRCDCGCGEHQFSVMFLPDEDRRYDMLCVEMLLSSRGFFRRLKCAVKYLFGRSCKYGAFDEILLMPEEAKRLHDYISEHLREEEHELEE